jgi:hypothetical protein
METLLNLTWLLVSAGLVITFRPKSRRVQIALLCAIALLFPIISVSDDLSAERDVLDHLAFLMPLFVVIAALMALALLEPPRVTRRRILLTVQADPRSPPRR